MNEIKSIQWNHWDRGVRERVGILGSAGEGIGLDPSEHCRVSCLLCCLQRIFFHYIPLCFFHFLLDARQQRYRISSNVLNPNLDSNFWCWSVHSLVHKRWYRRMVKHWAFSLKVWGPSLVHHCHASAFSSSWCVMIASETWGGKLSMISSWQSWHQWSSQLQLNGSLPCILYRNTSCHHTMSKCEMSKHYMLVGSSWWNVWGIGGTNWGSPSFCLTPIVQWTEIVMPEMPFERRMLRRNLPTLWHAMVYPSSFFPWIEKISHTRNTKDCQHEPQVDRCTQKVGKDTQGLPEHQLKVRCDEWTCCQGNHTCIKPDWSARWTLRQLCGLLKQPTREQLAVYQRIVKWKFLGSKVCNAWSFFKLVWFYVPCPQAVSLLTAVNPAISIVNTSQNLHCIPFQSGERCNLPCLTYQA